ncbi:hypothetical protein FSB78_09290 [Sphingomonas ginsenosidivorax]|uniref:Uncharacterized protein n=1 Tax=Sphingomonas ginsenosidivorax TaxID=862135 RepID=A0A5C6UF75_9SPHN|nr:hypothetical protein [Sphingomonas ginsenosidivorax]TXC71124.1 hypothetical protein FSB78_09290 [Sphingomonas ginsenosidivorax]
MNGAQDTDRNISVLLRLHDELDEAAGPMTAQAIAASFRPPVAVQTVENALADLLIKGWVISTRRFPLMTYKISRNGILEVERTHDISTTVNPGDGMIYRAYNSRQPGDVQSHFDWTKWGTIAASIFAVIAIVVAIWLDYN